MRLCLHFRPTLHVFKSFFVIKISQTVMKIPHDREKDDICLWQRPTWVPYADLLRRRWCRLAAWQRHTHTQLHKHTHTQLHKHTHTVTQTHTHTQLHKHTHTQTKSLMHTNTRTRTHTHTSFSQVAQTLSHEHDETEQQCTKPVFQRCRNNIILTHTSTRRLQA